MLAQKFPKPHANQKGQGLVEYLIIVALMGVASILIVRTLNEVVKSRFAVITQSLQGKKVNENAYSVQVEKRAYERSDLGNFMRGASESDHKRD